MKKIVSILMIVVMLAMGIVACGKKEANEKEAKDILVTRWSGGQSDDQKELVGQYEDANIVIDDVAYDKLKEKEVLSLQKSKNADYDLLYVAEVWTPDFAKNDWILPLNDMIEKNKIDISIFNQSLLDAMTVDGKIMALPTFIQTSILAYDNEAMERYGKGVPQTFDELIECAKWFKENENTGIAFTAMQGQAAVDLFGSILYSCGGDFIKNGKINLDSPEAKEAIGIWDELCKYGMDGVSTWHVDDVGQTMRDGVAPISISLSGNCSTYLDPNQSQVADKVKFAEMPTVGDKEYVGVANFWGWSVAKNSANQEAAFKAAAWLTDPKQEKEAALKNGSIPAIPELAEDKEVQEEVPYLMAVTNTLTNAKIIPTTGDSSTMLTDLQAALSQIASDPSVDAEKVIVDFNEKYLDSNF